MKEYVEENEMLIYRTKSQNGDIRVKIEKQLQTFTSKIGKYEKSYYVVTIFVKVSDIKTIVVCGSDENKSNAFAVAFMNLGFKYKELYYQETNNVEIDINEPKEIEIAK